jgi:Asp-tRNA(Asn)/Glu-tRNA(Gln) amidotransferase A subunit family amidase
LHWAICKNVTDARNHASDIAGHDEMDNSSADVQVDDYVAAIAEDSGKLKVGFLKNTSVKGWMMR